MYAYDHLDAKTDGEVERMFMFMSLRADFRQQKDIEIYEKLVHELKRRGLLQGDK